MANFLKKGPAELGAQMCVCIGLPAGLLKHRAWGIPGWLSGLAPAFGPGRDPGDPGLSPTSGSRHGACFSLCLCLCLSLSLYHEQINKS